MVLGSGLVWTVLIRVPLVLNAEDHLDSDLAVDGLTLLDAVRGHWRWHYPGTPHMGILPVLASYPQALMSGADPITLVSGGTIIWLLVVGSTFWLAGRAYGPTVAGWAIVPLVFSSLGTIWLSGRITGGHLLTLVWHTLAFVGLYVCLTRGRWPRAAALGLWCGLGLYLDAMFLFTLAGIVPAAMLAWLSTGRPSARNRAGGRFRRSRSWSVSFLVKSAGASIRTTLIPSQFDSDVRTAGDRATRAAAGPPLPAPADRWHGARSVGKGRHFAPGLGHGLVRSSAPGSSDPAGHTRMAGDHARDGFPGRDYRLRSRSGIDDRSRPHGGEPRRMASATADRRGVPGEPQHLTIRTTIAI